MGRALQRVCCGTTFVGVDPSDRGPSRWGFEMKQPRRSSSPSWRASGALARYSLSGLFFFICLWPLSVKATEPDWFNYQIQFPPPPQKGDDANNTIPDRARIVVNYLACSDDVNFYDLASGESGPDQLNGEGITATMIAKLQWLKTNSGSGVNLCKGESNIRISSLSKKDFTRLSTPNGEGMNHDMTELYKKGCESGVLTDAVQEGAGDSAFFHVTYAIGSACLAAQINFVLKGMGEGLKQLGTSGLPCLNTFSTTKGEWDVTVRDLIRILFLDMPRPGPAGVGPPSILQPDVRDHVQFDLITVSGPPGPSGYPVAGCGNTEHDIGPPQEREDEHNWVNDTSSSIGDFLDWLLFRLLLTIVFLTTAALLAGIIALSLWGPAIINVWKVVGLAGIAYTQIPETENHRLMLESSRFLNNQFIINSLGPDNASNTISDQAAVKQFLLGKFQDLLKQDFIEYNAIPYQRYSLTSLLNLADFSEDADVRVAAKMVLEYSATKFAVASNQGRRLVPFRRLMHEVACIMGPCIRDDSHTPGPKEEFELQAGADHQISLGLLFNGQTQQLLDGKVSTFSASEMIYAATSAFRPDHPLIPDLAIRKETPHFQRVHHAGFETYSSGPSALITAGGIETDYSSGVTVSSNSYGGRTLDRGAGVPTTIMLTGGPKIKSLGDSKTTSKTTVDTFIRIEGTPKQFGECDHATCESFEDNLCVGPNFACGTKIRVPDDIENPASTCLRQPDPSSHPSFSFFDSSTCPGYQDVPRFFLVLFRICEQDVCPSDNNAGFVEIVDFPVGSFDDFVTNVLQNNSGIGLGQDCLTQGNCKGHYQSVSGHDLALDLLGHQTNPLGTGIETIDGVPVKDLSQLNFAEGDVINAQGDGLVIITNSRLGLELDLDLRDANHPCRRLGPNQPCTE
jgi:hypothetical protein